MCRACQATEGDLERVVREANHDDLDRFYVVRDADGKIERLGVNHGHSEASFGDVQIDQLLSRAELDDLPQNGIMLHGTRMQYAHRINQEGLIADGGDSRANRRVHIHLVRSVDGRNRIPGVRPGSDVVVHVNIREFMQTGGECWWARNGCLLTEGF